MTRSLLLLGLFAGCVNADQPLNPGDSSTFEVEVAPGSTARTIGPMLISEGLVAGEWQYKVFLKTSPEEGACLKAGRFRLRHDMSLREALGTLCGVPLPDDVPFTVVEGWRIREIDEALAAKGWIEPGAYAALAESKAVDLPFEITSPTLEGYLYPETYNVPPPPGFDPKWFIERQLKTFDEVFRSKHEAEIAERGLHEVVVMASMLEREEPKESQRPVTAGILWKRIDNGWQLGVDATSRYTLPEWNDRSAFLKKLRDPEDPYNTRIHKGLPPTAIGNPSVSSLEAAIAPVPSEYWFYLHDSTGTFHGATDAAGHESNRKKYGVY